MLKAQGLGSRSRRTESGAPHGAPPNNAVAICAGRRADDRRGQSPAQIALPAAHPSRRCPGALTRGARPWRATQRVLRDPCWPVRRRPARAVPATSFSLVHHQQQYSAVHGLAHLTQSSPAGGQLNMGKPSTGRDSDRARYPMLCRARLVQRFVIPRIRGPRHHQVLEHHHRREGLHTWPGAPGWRATQRVHRDLCRPARELAERPNPLYRRAGAPRGLAQRRPRRCDAELSSAITIIGMASAV